MTRGSGQLVPSTLIHIGMPKCGSTWLQRQLFKPINGYLLRFGPIQSKLAFVDGHAREWRPPEKLLGLKRAGGRVPTISGEMLAGDPLTGGRDRAIILARLQQTLPRARILIVIREQVDMFRSLYKLLVNWGYSATPEELIREEGDPSSHRFQLDYLSYHNLIADYQRAFGRDRVLVLPFEQLRADPQGFVDTINAFSECRPIEGRVQVEPEQVLNPGRELTSLQVKRLYNRYIARTPFSPRGLYRPASIHSAGNVQIPVPLFLEERLERVFRQGTESTLRARYDQSNLLTARLTGLDLTRYGYSCARGDTIPAPDATQTRDVP